MRVRAPLLAAVAALLACAAPASAATYTVNTTADNAAADCTTACSLRGAIGAANKVPGSTINLPANSYTLNLQTNGQLPAITTDMTITGASAATTTIRGDGKNGRIFTVSSAGGHARISHLRLTFASVLSLPTAADQIGGIILVDSGSTLDLDHARVDRGDATRGGGIAIRGGTANITKSAIETNHATFVSGNLPTADGAGILVFGQTGRIVNNPAHLTLTDSTVAHNTTTSAAGIESTGNANNTVTITRSTVAYNDGGASTGNGVFLDQSAGSITVTGSIVAGNTGDNPTPPDNCSLGITNGGGTAEDGTGCGFTKNVASAASLVSSTLTSAGETVVLPLPAGSVAIDLAGACTGADQRDLPRPQGAACDAGAYEVDQPFTSEIDSGPSGVVTSSTASFTFSASEPGVTFQCKLDGPQVPGGFGGCVSPASFGTLGPGVYTFTLQATDAGGHQVTSVRSFAVAATAQQTPSPTPTPSPSPSPTPVRNKSVVIQPLTGKVLVKLPGSSKFEPVDVTRGIPNGATVDVRKGKIRLTAIPKAGKPAESALFYDGIFKLKLAGGITELRLTEALSCPKAGKADVSAKKPKSRKLWGSGSGSFRTRGQYSAATVRGTTWLVQDTCTTTLTRVTKGVVSVNDFVKHKTKLLRAPHRYTARKKH